MNAHLDDPLDSELGGVDCLPEGVRLCRTCGATPEPGIDWCWDCWRDGSTLSSPTEDEPDYDEEDAA